MPPAPRLLRVVDGEWLVQRSGADRLDLGGRVSAASSVPHRPLWLVGVRPRTRLLSGAAVDDLHVRSWVRFTEPAWADRADGYQPAVRVGPGGTPAVHWDVVVEVKGPAHVLDQVYAIHLMLALDTDGPRGPRPVVHHVVASMGGPQPGVDPDWHSAGPGLLVRPLRTHLLGPLDDPVDLVARYASPHAQPGDVVVLGESPLAVVQGRFSDPAGGRPGWLASRLAQFMSGEGSVGTGPGLQALVDEVGRARVLAALAGGAVGKLVGRDGWFYRLAGRPSSLIDDVTGTLPPYDKLIVAGPRDAAAVCRRIRSVTGLDAAVADANDLGAVDVIGASPGLDPELVRRALRTNPAGNAAESTPLVLIRRT